MVLTEAGRETILDEIANCELVCANCCAVRTFDRYRGVAQPGRALAGSRGFRRFGPAFDFVRLAAPVAGWAAALASSRPRLLRRATKGHKRLRLPNDRSRRGTERGR